MKLHKRGLRYAIPLFSAVAGALMLTAAFVPQTNAAPTLQAYFNFNSETNGQAPPYTSVPPGLQTTTLFNDVTNPFPAGHISVNSTAGTTLNSADAVPVAGGALDLSGNSNIPTKIYCFNIGPINTTGGEPVSLSFALMSIGNGGQFKELDLAYSTNGTTFTNFATFTDLQTHTTFFTYNSALPAGAENQSALYIQFCFTGSKNSAVGNHTYVDNIQITTAVPEPATAVSGVLAVLAVFGLCWSQRQRLIQSLRFRRT